MGFRSIQTKYIVLVLCCVIASALLIGGVCVRNVAQSSVNEAAQNMNLTCESYKYKFDESLKIVQNSVESSAYFASLSLDSIERFSSDEEYRDFYANQLETMLSVEVHNTNIISYYVRFSPDLLHFEKGFRYMRPSAKQPFERIDTVRIEDYRESDSERVGWYYEPIENGVTTWLEPYYNQNLKKQMISCVTPFYKDDVLVGVVGMDIDFATLVDDLEELRIFDNGYAFLCSAAGEVYYHPLYDEGTFIQQDVDGFDAQLEEESSGSVLYNGVSNGESVEYAFRSLTNGMRLVLRAPQAEINADTMALVRTIALLVLGIVAVFVVITVVVSYRITRPLRDLTVAAERISQGNYDIKIDVKARDEVGMLARTLKTAAVELKAHSERMRQLAYKDSLTGVRNKTAYDLETSVLDSEIENDSASFGIVVFDVNDLKTANDLYGHEQGDKVIREGCMRICKAFPHSPVYRIGGDEFVAVLEGDELERVEERLYHFEGLGRINASEAKTTQDIVRVAYGAAIYDEEKDENVQDVFNRADASMYTMKELMKS